MSRVATPPLREGFTTGTAAAGAALAALILLRTGHAPQSVHVPLPPFMPAGGEDAFSGRCARDWRVLSVAHCAAGLAPELLEKAGQLSLRIENRNLLLLTEEELEEYLKNNGGIAT